MGRPCLWVVMSSLLRMKSVLLTFAFTFSSLALADLGIFQSILKSSDSSLSTRALFITQYRNFENAARSSLKAEHKSRKWRRWLLHKQLEADWKRRSVKKVNKLEVDFCDGAHHTGTIDFASVSPFPVKIATGASVKVKAQFTLSEQILEGATVSLEIQKKEPWWLPNIHVPCIVVEGIKVGSCEYSVSWLLERGAHYLCPEHFPPGQACKLPLLPGVYGGSNPLRLGPIQSVPNIIADLIGSGEYDARVKLYSKEGKLITCIISKVQLTGPGME